MGKMTSEQASLVKRRGHKREETFNKIFDSCGVEINYSGASADCSITKQKYIDVLRDSGVLRRDVEPFVSLKGGNTIQIHLGNIPELTGTYSTESHSGKTIVTHDKSFEEQLKSLQDRVFWRRYLKKGNLLCYYDDNSSWKFFDMDAVIDFIVERVEWRLLDTGRIKGDLGSKRGLFTYELRNKKNTFVLGAHGGKNGKELIGHLEDNIPFMEIVVE